MNIEDYYAGRGCGSCLLNLIIVIITVSILISEYDINWFLAIILAFICWWLFQLIWNIIRMFLGL